MAVVACHRVLPRNATAMDLNVVIHLIPQKMPPSAMEISAEIPGVFIVVSYDLWKSPCSVISKLPYVICLDSY